MPQVYLDHAATTPLRPEVLEVMLPYFKERWGNPSSTHTLGIEALEGIERAREKVANLLGAETDEIVFTSGATEANNHAMIGTYLAHRKADTHIVTSAIEHPAVMETARFLESCNCRVTYLPVDSYGLVDLDALRKAITADTTLVSVMHANNEVGTIQPIREIGAICRERGVLFHTDAAQTAGHLPINVNEFDIDLLSLSAHKFYGPKGVGALFIRKGIKITPLLHGGAQELRRRASTENIAGIIGLGEATSLVQTEMTSEIAHTTELRDQLIEGVRKQAPEAMLVGHPTARLPNNASFLIPGIDRERLVLALDKMGFAISAGAAYASYGEGSYVLAAMGVACDLSAGFIRVSVGMGNTTNDVKRFLDSFPSAVVQSHRIGAGMLMNGKEL